MTAENRDRRAAVEECFYRAMLEQSAVMRQ